MSRKKTRTCSECGERFARPENLTEHIQVTHTEKVKKLLCPLCTDLISKVTNLRKHITRRHSQSPKFLTNNGGIAKWKGKKIKVEFVKQSQLYRGRFIRECRQIDSDISDTDDVLPPPSKQKKRAILSDDDNVGPVIPCEQDINCDINDSISTHNSIGHQNLSENMPLFVAVKEEHAESDGSDTLKTELDWQTMMINYEPLKGLIQRAMTSEHILKLCGTLVSSILEWIENAERSTISNAASAELENELEINRTHGFIQDLLRRLRNGELRSVNGTAFLLFQIAEQGIGEMSASDHGEIKEENQPADEF